MNETRTTPAHPSRRFAANGAACAAALALSGCYNVNSFVDAPDANPGDGVCARSPTLRDARAGLRPPAGAPALAGWARDFAGQLGLDELARLAQGDAAASERLQLRLARHPARAAILRLLAAGRGPGGGPPDDFGSDTSRLCTLRAAIMEANAWPWKSVIQVPAGTYPLTLPAAAGGGSLKITRSMRIQGSDAPFTIVDGLGTTNVFYIDALIGDVELNHLTVQGGGNSQAGGGVYANRGQTELEDLIIRENSAFTGGGGLLVNEQATVYVRRSIISGNSATGAFGGGIWNAGELWVYDSTISGNESNRAGGIHNSGEMNLRNVTVSGNYAHSDEAGVGGVRQWGFAVLNNVTITDNEGIGTDPAFDRGGGLATSAAGTTVMKNSIVAANNGNGGPDDCVGPLTSDSNRNLIGNSTGCEIGGLLSDHLLDMSANLGPLANNGGPTMTHMPQSNSPARDGGYGFPPPAFDACEALDQRGVPRPQGAGGCDIGAVEYTPAFSFVTGFMLVDAATDTDIRPLRNDDWIVLAQLPPQLSIRATVSGAPGSVVFGFANDPAYQTENIAPYALGGDAGGNYLPVPLTGGSHVLTATPYVQADGAGAAGGGRTIRFNVLQVN